MAMRHLLLFLILATHLHGAGLGVYNPAQHAINGFMPTQLPGLQLWLDAGRQGYTNQANVSNWNDFSGLSNSATNGSSSLRPVYISSALNGRASVRFDGTDDYLSCTKAMLPTNAVGFICVAARQRTTNSTGQPLLGQRGNGVTWRFAWALNQDSGGNALTNAINIFHNGVTQGSGTNGLIKTITNAPPEILIALNNYGGTEGGDVYSKGALEDTFTMPGAANLAFWIGSANQSSQWFNGDIMEVVVGTNALPFSQLSQLQRYLGTKYGIVVQ